MLDFGTAIDLLKQYGYSSTTSHPYLYQTEDAIGICYVYNDEDFGSLERVKIFKDLESFEQFLKEIEWIKANGMQRHVRMILDNYEAVAPKVMYLRNEKLMVEGEMFDIENFDFREAQRESMDATSQVIYEAGDLLLVYDEMKGRQLQYLKNIIKLKNSLRQKYFDLQKEVDEYNKYKITRELKLLPEVADSGINETMEIALKDKYNMYIAERPPYEEACEFLKEVWDLCMQLELNLKYYDAQKDENAVHNELRIVNEKLDLMMKLNDEGRPLFGIDLVGRFRKINKVCLSESSFISEEWIHEQAENIERKYAVFNNIDIINTSDYLREAIQNSNYADLAIKYRKGVNIHERMKAKVPLNEVAANLSLQYSNSLTPQQQAILVLYNNHKYRKLCDAILRVENFEQLPVKKVISIISKTKEYSKIKSIVYDAVKKRINDPINANIKNSIFSQFDFSTYETFISSIINSLIQLKAINTKMVLSGDINMYITVDNVEEINNCRFTNVTNALNDLLGRTKGTKTMIGIVLLKEGTPVLYSPYYLDLGDVYAKGASLQMAIKEMVNFELLVDCSDIIINIDPKKTTVVRYYSTPKTVEDVSVVSELKMNYKTIFCKYAFTSKFSENVVVNNTVPVTNTVDNQVTNMVGNGNMAPVITNVGVTEVPVNPVPEVGVVNKEAVVNNEVPPVSSDVVVNNEIPSVNNDVVVNSEIPLVNNYVAVNNEMPIVNNEVVVNNEMPIINSDVTNVVTDNVVPEVSQVPAVESSSDVSEGNSGTAIEMPIPVAEDKQDMTVEVTGTSEENKQEEVSDVQDNNTAIEPVPVIKEEETELEDTGKMDSDEENSKNNDTETKEEEVQSILPVIETTADEIKVEEKDETDSNDKKDDVIPVPLDLDKVVGDSDKEEKQNSEDLKKDVSVEKEKTTNMEQPVKPVLSDVHKDETKPVVKPVESGMKPVGVARKPVISEVRKPMNPNMQHKGVPIRRDGVKPNGMGVKPPIRPVPVKSSNGSLRPSNGMIKQGQRPVEAGARPRMVRPGVRMIDGKMVPPVRRDGQRPNAVPSVKPVNGINGNTGLQNGVKRVVPPKISGMPVGVNGVKRPVSGERPIRKIEGPVREGMKPINPQARMNRVPIRREAGSNTGNTLNRPQPSNVIGTNDVRKNDNLVKPVSSGLIIEKNSTDDNKKGGSVNNERS